MTAGNQAGMTPWLPRASYVAPATHAAPTDSLWEQPQSGFVDSLLGRFKVGVEDEELFHVGHLHGAANPVGDAGKGKAAAIFLMIDVGSYQSPDPGGINVGHFGQVENQDAVQIPADQSLKFKEI